MIRTGYILFLLMVVTGACVAFMGTSIEAKTVYVDDDNTGGVNGTFSDPVPTIGMAVDLAGSNDTIYIYNGDYTGTVHINRTIFNGSALAVVGQSEAGVVLDSGEEDGFVLEQIGISMSRLTIESASTAIRANDVVGDISDVTIQPGVDVLLSRTGFRIEDCADLVLDSLTVSDISMIGEIVDSKRCVLSNTTSDHDTPDAPRGQLILSNSWGCVVENTTIESNNTFGLGVFGRYDNTIRRSLVINGEAIHYYHDVHGTAGDYEVISGLTLRMVQVSTIGKITLANCSYVRIEDNDLANQPYGSSVVLWNCENIEVGNNSFNEGTGSMGDSGVTAYDCADLFLHNFTTQYVMAGIRFVDTSDSYIFNVSSVDNGWGARIEGGWNNRINHSLLSVNLDAGLALIDTYGNRVTNTTMYNNDKYGYFIEGDFDNELDTTNTVNSEPVHYYNDRGSNVRIDGLTLTAEDVSNVGKVTIFDSRNIVVTNCTLKKNGHGSGIFVIDSRNITVSNNSMRNNLRGISLLNSRLCSLDGNDMDSLEFGLFVEDRYDNWINASNTANGEAIRYFFRNDSIDITDLVLKGRRVSNVGKVTIVQSDHVTVDQCDLQNGSSGVLVVDGSVNVTSSTIKRNVEGVTLLSGSATVTECDVLRNDIGIPAEGRITVSWNRIDNNAIGVLCSNRSTIENNTMDGNDNGLVIVGMENRVANNSVVASFYSGIDVDGSDNIVLNNTCVGNRYGIFIRGGRGIDVLGNTVRRNDRYGIRISGTPKDMNVSGNTVFGNGDGELTGSGILISGARDLLIGHNSIHSNYFADVLVKQSDNVTIGRCDLNDTYEGFEIFESSNITIENNTIASSRFPVIALDSEHVTITDNVITNADPIGIWSSSSRDCYISGNYVDANESAVKVAGGRRAVIRGNDLTATESVTIVASSGNTVHQNEFNGDVGVMVRSGASFNTIEDCNLSGLATPVSVSSSNETILRNCTFVGSDIAVNMFESTDARIEDCEFYGNRVPVFLNESDYNVVVDCSFTRAEKAILFNDSRRNIVRRAVFSGSSEAFNDHDGFMNSLQGTDATGVDVPVKISGGTKAFFINVTFNEGDRDIRDTSVLYIYNMLMIRVLYFDGTPIEGADAVCTSGSEDEYRTGGYGGVDPRTNASGTTGWFRVAYKTFRNSSVITPNVSAGASYLYWNESRDIDMGTSHVEEFISDIAPPSLDWTNETDFVDTGFHPAMGNASQQFEFRVLYTDPNDDPPLNGTPALWIDVDGDGKYRSNFSYVDGTFYEGSFNMSKVGSSTDYASGVIYNFSTRLPVSHTIRYHVEGTDANGLSAIRWDPVLTQKGPIVLSASIDVRTVRFEDGMTEVHFTYLLSNDTYVTDIDNSTSSLWDDGNMEIEVREPGTRNISLLMDWSNSLPSELRSTVHGWMLPFLENMTGSEAVEVIKYSTDVFPISEFNTSTGVVSDAINASVSAGSEAHLYDAIAEHDLGGQRQHMLIVAFGPNYADNPKQHTPYEELIGNISAGTTVHVIAHGAFDMSELAHIATVTRGTFTVVDDDTLASAIVGVLGGLQKEILLTYDANLTFDGSEHDCVLNASHLMIDASGEFDFAEPITPPPTVEISAPGGWWTLPTLPLTISIEGELEELTVQMIRGDLRDGVVSNWTEWMNVTVSGGYLDVNLTNGAYRFRARGFSISGNSKGWANETSGNVTMVDLTPPTMEAAVPDSPSWDRSQLSLDVGNATDPESGITTLNVSVSFGSGTPIDAYSVPWTGEGYHVVLKQMEWRPAIYSILLTVTNGAGSTAEEVVQIILDDSLPSVRVEAPDNWTVQGWANVSVTSTGNVSNVTLQVASAGLDSAIDPDNAAWTTLLVEDDGEVWSSFNITHNASLTHAMQYMFRARGSNSQTGRTGPWNHSGVLMVDMVPPEANKVTLGGDRDSLFISFIATDDGSGMGGYSYVVNRDAGTFATGSGATDGTDTIEVEGPVGEGTYVAVLTFSDQAGGTSEQVSSSTLVITDGPPTVPVLVHPADGEIVGIPPMLSWNASTEPEGDDVSYDLVVTGPTGEVLRTSLTETYHQLDTIPLGDYTWTVSSSDGTYSSEPAEAGFLYSRPDLRPTFMFYVNEPVTHMDFPGTVSIASTVENVGQVGSPAVNVTFVLDGDTVKTAHVPDLEPGSSGTVTFSVDLDIGSHTMVMTVDPDDVVFELDDDNNSYSRTITVGDVPEDDEGKEDISLMPVIAAIILAVVLAILLIVMLKMRKGRFKRKGKGPARKSTGKPAPKTMDVSEYEKLRREFAAEEEDAIWEERPRRPPAKTPKKVPKKRVK